MVLPTVITIAIASTLVAVLFQPVQAEAMIEIIIAPMVVIPLVIVSVLVVGPLVNIIAQATQKRLVPPSV